MNIKTTPTPLIEQLMARYADFSLVSLPDIISLYAKEVVFIDPVGQVDGKDQLERYFHAMAEGLEFCRFEFDSSIFSAEANDCYQCALFWTMHYAHPRIARGQPAALNGSSHIRYSSEGIVYHRDYYDLGEMLFERLPLMGPAIRLIKRRMEHS